jgi:hypothetical protein
MCGNIGTGGYVFMGSHHVLMVWAVGYFYGTHGCGSHIAGIAFQSRYRHILGFVV